MHTRRIIPAFGLITLLMACGQQGPGPSGGGNVTPMGAGGVSGAAFTTINPAQTLISPDTAHCLNGTGLVNCNIYPRKAYVWINGGPQQPGPSALSDGWYFFSVLEPSGQSDPNDGGKGNLSDTNPLGGSGSTGGGDAYTNRVFHVTGGDIDSYSGSHDQETTTNHGLIINAMPFDDTSNPGGVYIMALCKINPATYHPTANPARPNDCKYDAFKVRNGDPADVSWFVEGYKYYDGNTDGAFGNDEDGIPNWQIALNVNGTPVSPDLITNLSGYWVYATSPAAPVAATASVTVTERMPVSVPGVTWRQTGNRAYDASDNSNTTVTTTLTGDVISQYTVTVPLDQDASASNLDFGNVCDRHPGGRTMGFWSNKNGQALIGNADLAALATTYNLRKADGSDFDPGSKAAYRSWLLGADAANMAYMLSAQMSATYLNTRYGDTPGSTFTDPNFVVDGTRTVTQQIAYANALLANPIASGPFMGMHGGLTVASGALRAEQERVKNILDRVNNNGGFLQPTQATCPAPTFP